MQTCEEDTEQKHQNVSRQKRKANARHTKHTKSPNLIHIYISIYFIKRKANNFFSDSGKLSLTLMPK